MQLKLRITFVFFFIAATFGLLLRMEQAGLLSYNYKNLLHTHSHIALLGWMYNAAIILLQYTVFKKETKSLNTIFWISQVTFVGMLFSFPFEGYRLFSITFSTLYLFCSYFLVGQLFKHSNKLSSPYVAKFIKWSGIYLVLSSLGPFALAVIMAKGLADTFWYKLAIYWFLHFLYNGFFVFVFFSYFLNTFGERKYYKLIFLLMNSSVVPLYALSTLWLKPEISVYMLSAVVAIFQLIAFVLLLKGQEIKLHFRNRLSWNLIRLVFIAYGLKVIFQLLASSSGVQKFISDTISFSVIGFIHLVMLGVFTLFFIAIFINENYFRQSKLVTLGVYLLVAGIIGSETLLFAQSAIVYFWHTGILEIFNWLFWVSTLMPVGIGMIAVESFRKKEG